MMIFDLRSFEIGAVVGLFAGIASAAALKIRYLRSARMAMEGYRHTTEASTHALLESLLGTLGTTFRGSQTGELRATLSRIRERLSASPGKELDTQTRAELIQLLDELDTRWERLSSNHAELANSIRAILDNQAKGHPSPGTGNPSHPR